MQTRSKNNIIKPIKKLTLTASLLKSPACEPRTIQQALKDKRWCPAATTEFDAMMQNRTWDLVPPHPTQNLVSCRWIFTTKYLPNVTGNDNNVIARVLHSLADRFPIKDPTDLHYFLGIEATRTKKGLHLMQRRYILDLLAKNNMTEAKQVSTPLPSSPKLTLASGIPLQDPSQYRSVVGSLQYLAFTRPDITYAVNRLSQFMHKPTDEHWQGAKRVLRYLAGTPSHGLFLQRHSPMTLHGFSDADWAGDTHDYVSTNAYVVYLGINPISWSSKKQNGGACSSTEAEYRAVANITSEMNWITSLLTELGYKPPAVPVVYCDNIGATYLCANPVFHSRMKHTP
ncbi:PREDICTED: uncharacterized mitochondrial protein AtMg00810-like [Brassica oleracea var. oleracea]|uniref:uncharacterized mitochondrial protein AtMg00810-like n=1 Tax=Brassica oleracea var. oleracea TaxID=109376 RepID=UPI0006A71C86|nr:PREDICTED: uncharacterized mitochondrial protein AtMg00810-like [Brassica oleracea var. oleracea]